jgi:hypothetical protein
VGGRVESVGPAATVLADPRLRELGVDPPPSARIARALAAAGHADRLTGIDLVALEAEPTATEPSTSELTATGGQVGG